MEFPTYDWNRHILSMRKTKKMNQINFGHKLRKLVSNLKMNIIKCGKNEIQKIYDNFGVLVQILKKIIINFSDLSIFPIYVRVIFNLDD